MRLPPTKEHDLMFPETNEHNIKELCNLLPHWFLSSSSNKYVLDKIHNGFPFLNSYFKLNSQRRAWFKLPDLPELDNAYKAFIDTFDRHLNGNTIKSYDFFIATRGKKIDDYETFKKGKVHIGKQEIKLFKWLKKEGLFSDNEINAITTIKNSNNLYLCISNNPVDFVFASTNQSFSSCISLDSNYSDSYYMGLPGTFVDPNRLLIFITNGKLRKYSVHDCNFKHFRVIQRTWALLMQDNSLSLIRNYPGNNVDLKLILETIGFSVNTDAIQGKKSFYLPYFSNENTENCMIYLDNIGLRVDYSTEQYMYDKQNGSTGCPFFLFNNSDGFGSIDDIDDISNGGCVCDGCGARLDEDATYSDDYNTYCQDCFYEIYSYCENCGEYVSNDYIMRGADDNYYCEYCWQERFTDCCHCNDTIDKDEAFYNDNGEAFCHDCYTGFYFYCEHCDSDVNRDNYTETPEGEPICEDCFKDKYVECSECGEIIERNESKLCEDCESQQEAA